MMLSTNSVGFGKRIFSVPLIQDFLLLVRSWWRNKGVFYHGSQLEGNGQHPSFGHVPTRQLCSLSPVEAMFSAMCECQALHPDPEDEDSDNDYEGEEYDVEARGS